MHRHDHDVYDDVKVKVEGLMSTVRETYNSAVPAPFQKMPIASLPDPDLGHPLEPEKLLIPNEDSILLDSLS